MNLKVKSKAKGKSVLHDVKKELDIINNLEIIDIDSIKPWEKNPKKYNKKIDEICESLKIYGQRTPVSVWRKNRKIYKGNNTYFAMKKLGYKKIAVVWQDFKTEREAAGYAMIDNTTGEGQEWDAGKLAALLQGEEFQGMKASEISKITGFKDKDLKGYLLSTTELPDVLPDVDLSGEVPDKADFIVIQFPSKEKMQWFKKRLGFATKHPRVVNYEDLMTVMEWKETEETSTVKSKGKIKLKMKR
ncbi:MAG: ParB N-terminal domain-containing protein [Bacteroidales bacterium]